MSKAEPNAPEGFVWLFLEIDVPTSRDFIGAEEQKIGRALTHEEAAVFLMDEFHFTRNRAKQIVDTIKGEIYVPVAQLDRASDSESEGRVFESRQERQL